MESVDSGFLVCFCVPSAKGGAKEYIYQLESKKPLLIHLEKESEWKGKTPITTKTD